MTSKTLEKTCFSVLNIFDVFCLHFHPFCVRACARDEPLRNEIWKVFRGFSRQKNTWLDGAVPLTAIASIQIRCPWVSLSFVLLRCGPKKMRSKFRDAPRFLNLGIVRALFHKDRRRSCQARETILRRRALFFFEKKKRAGFARLLSIVLASRKIDEMHESARVGILRVSSYSPAFAESVKIFFPCFSEGGNKMRFQDLSEEPYVVNQLYWWKSEEDKVKIWSDDWDRILFSRLYASTLMFFE